MTTPEKLPSPVSYQSCRNDAGIIDWCGVVVGLLNSECPQQHGADENEYGAYRQYIQPQGKVHGRASLVEMGQATIKRRQPK
jgi:hypothetical protein